MNILFTSSMLLCILCTLKFTGKPEHTSKPNYADVSKDSISPYHNPTGTYKLISKTYKKNGETYGKYGTIQIKPLTPEKIIMSFFVSIGALSYNSGSFIDTLPYLNNQILYTCPEYDESCEIKFVFTKKKITAYEKTEDLIMGCGFGADVRADGLQFRKVSSKIPTIEDFTTGEKFK